MDYKKRTLLLLEKHSAELFRFTRRLIAAPSPNPPGDEVAMADLVIERMQDLGLANPVIEAKAPCRQPKFMLWAFWPIFQPPIRIKENCVERSED